MTLFARAIFQYLSESHFAKFIGLKKKKKKKNTQENQSLGKAEHIEKNSTNVFEILCSFVVRN
jgi:hypothetical protein